MKKEEKKNNLEIFRKKCREHGLKVTPKRILIYRELIKSKDHPSPEILFKRIRYKSPGISLDTVYRSLSVFHEIGLADIVEGFTLTRRFEPDKNNHHHARCIKCQSIVDFENRQFDDLKIPGEIQKHFDIQRVKVTIEGMCKKCKSLESDDK